MGNFYAFTFCRKHDGVITDDIACTDGGEADGVAISFASATFTAIDGTFA
jgi:hypothetical protein